jgi:hypothetical protein
MTLPNCAKCGQPVLPQDDAVRMDMFRSSAHAATLFLAPAVHIRCSPSRAQYIIAPEFGEPVVDDRPQYDKRLRHEHERAEREAETTSCWWQLQNHVMLVAITESEQAKQAKQAKQ